MSQSDEPADPKAVEEATNRLQEIRGSLENYIEIASNVNIPIAPGSDTQVPDSTKNPYNEEIDRANGQLDNLNEAESLLGGAGSTKPVSIEDLNEAEDIIYIAEQDIKEYEEVPPDEGEDDEADPFDTDEDDNSEDEDED